MQTFDEAIQDGGVAVEADSPYTLGGEMKSLVERTYGVEFTILDGASGEVLYAAPGQPPREWETRAEICREVARRGTPEFLDDEDPLVTMALPLTDAQGEQTLAVATFLTRPGADAKDLFPRGEGAGH